MKNREREGEKVGRGRERREREGGREVEGEREVKGEKRKEGEGGIPALIRPCRPPTNTVRFGSSLGEGQRMELESERAQGMIWTSLSLTRRLEILK